MPPKAKQTKPMKAIKKPAGKATKKPAGKAPAMKSMKATKATKTKKAMKRPAAKAMKAMKAMNPTKEMKATKAKVDDCGAGGAENEAPAWAVPPFYVQGAFVDCAQLVGRRWVMSETIPLAVTVGELVETMTSPGCREDMWYEPIGLALAVRAHRKDAVDQDDDKRSDDDKKKDDDSSTDDSEKKDDDTRSDDDKKKDDGMPGGSGDVFQPRTPPYAFPPEREDDKKRDDDKRKADKRDDDKKAEQRLGSFGRHWENLDMFREDWNLNHTWWQWRPEGTP